MKKKFVFLDRDGTVCLDKNYLSDYREMEFFPFSVEAIKIMKSKGYLVSIVTNQSGVARKKFDIEEAEKQKGYFINYFKTFGVQIDGYYYCPHHPNGIDNRYAIKCNCRKPEKGLIEKATHDYDVDMANSYVVGDKKNDIELAINVGAIPVLVRTGYGMEEEKKINKKKILIFDNILEFALFL